MESHQNTLEKAVEVASAWRKKMIANIRRTIVHLPPTDADNRDGEYSKTENTSAETVTGFENEPWQQLFGDDFQTPPGSYGAVHLPHTRNSLVQIIKRMTKCTKDIVESSLSDTMQDPPNEANLSSTPQLPPGAPISTERDTGRNSVLRATFSGPAMETQFKLSLLYARSSFLDSRAHCWYTIHKFARESFYLRHQSFLELSERLATICIKPMLRDSTAARELSVNTFGYNHASTLDMIIIQLTAMLHHGSSKAQSYIDEAKEVYVRGSKNAVSAENLLDTDNETFTLALEKLRMFLDTLPDWQQPLPPVEMTPQSLTPAFITATIGALQELLNVVDEYSNRIWKTTTYLQGTQYKEQRRLSMLTTPRNLTSARSSYRENSNDTDKLAALHVLPPVHIAEFELIQSTWPEHKHRPLTTKDLGSPHLTLVPLYSLFLHYSEAIKFPEHSNRKLDTAKPNKDPLMPSYYTTASKCLTQKVNDCLDPTADDLRDIKRLVKTFGNGLRMSERNVKRFLKDFGVLSSTKCSEKDVAAILCCTTSGDQPVLIESVMKGYDGKPSTDNLMLTSSQYAERSQFTRKFQLKTFNKAYRSLLPFTDKSLVKRKGTFALSHTEASLRKIPLAKLNTHDIILPDDEDPNGKYSVNISQFLDLIARIALVYVSRKTDKKTTSKASFIEKIKMFCSKELGLYAVSSNNNGSSEQLVSNFIRKVQLQQSGKKIISSSSDAKQCFTVSLPAWDWSRQLKFLRDRKKILDLREE